MTNATEATAILTRELRELTADEIAAVAGGKSFSVPPALFGVPLPDPAELIPPLPHGPPAPTEGEKSAAASFVMGKLFG
jgi:hypothetical protein